MHQAICEIECCVFYLHPSLLFYEQTPFRYALYKAHWLKVNYMKYLKIYF